MKPLSPYGRMAERHWRRFLPRMVAELEAQGPAARDAAGGGGADRRGAGFAAPPLHPAGPDTPAGPRPGLGDRAGAVPLPAAGDGTAGDEEWVAFGPAAAEPEPLRNQRNYRITDADRLGAGSLKRKCQDNLAAIELLKRLEAEGRAADATTRSACWCATSAGAACRRSSMRGMRSGRNSASGWSNCSRPEELDSARATTLNAHYTAPVVIRAMYAALQRLGFHARAHPGTGAGPGPLHRPHARGDARPLAASPASRLIRSPPGWRSALYPDADIRHQPFEESKLADGFYDVAISNIPFGDFTILRPPVQGAGSSSSTITSSPPPWTRSGPAA